MTRSTAIPVGIRFATPWVRKLQRRRPSHDPCGLCCSQCESHLQWLRTSLEKSTFCSIQATLTSAEALPQIARRLTYACKWRLSLNLATLDFNCMKLLRSIDTASALYGLPYQSITRIHRFSMFATSTTSSTITLMRSGTSLGIRIRGS